MEELLKFWRAGVGAVEGGQCVGAWFDANPEFRPSHIAAIGKAAPMMTAGAVASLGETPPTLVITKKGHGSCLLKGTEVTLLESAHPVPDRSSLDAGRALLEFIASCPPEGILLMLVSGGASALAEVLNEPHTLAELSALNQEMLAQALDIAEINSRRSRISAIKGGGLLRALRSAVVQVLAISDVPGDDIAIIGSGVGDPSLCAAVDCRAEVIASNSIARNAAAEQARRAGYRVVRNEENLHGEMGVVAEMLASMIIDGPAGVYLFGGEPFLALPDTPGEGGRNQALALEIASRIDGRANIGFLSAGTDGGDGPGPAAGGFVTGSTWRDTPGGDIARQNADSGRWLRRAGGLIMTGPTGTNVMDLAIGLKSE